MSIDDNVLTWDKIAPMARALEVERRAFESKLTRMYVDMRLVGFSHGRIRARFQAAGISQSDLKFVDSLGERWDKMEEAARNDNSKG